MHRHRSSIAFLYSLILFSALVPGPFHTARETALFSPPSDGREPQVPPLALSEIPHPADFLGYPLGERFTHHHRMLDYLEALEAASDRLSSEPYGTTYEGRPLKLFVVTSPANQARLEQLRRNQLRLAEPATLSPGERRDLNADQPAFVWLAYGVHGSEASSSEAALATAYALAAGGEQVAAWLDEVVVIIDPLVNPDGRERYVQGYESRRGLRPDPQPDASEHTEPWPGGRYNHYLFDLNRDWTWASQVETRQRLVAYRRWEPHVYADLHEMNPASSYFFPPAAEPINAEIHPRVVDWLETFGRENAAAFDDQGWIYYVREVFDLYYPGYGDTYPALRGAVGMTYEMAGGGSAGLDLELGDGRRLKLADRIGRHFTASLTTIRTTAENRSSLISDFVAGRELRAERRTYLWRADQQEARALVDLLARHGVRVGSLGEKRRLAVTPLIEGDAVVEKTFPAGTFAASTDQPLGNLLRALFEPEPQGITAALIDRQRRRVENRQSLEFFDITSWSLPLAHNLRMWRAGTDLPDLAPIPAPVSGLQGEGSVGFLIAPQGLASYRVAARLLAERVVLRLASSDFEHGAKSWPSGTLFVPAVGNRPEIDSQLDTWLREAGVTGQRVATSYSKRASLGSDQMLPLRPVRAGLVGGQGIRPTSFGFAWHLLDQQIRMNYSRIDLAALDTLDLRRFDVLIFPDGHGYNRALDGEPGEALERWIRAGGQLVAIGDRATKVLKDKEWITLEHWQAPDEDEVSIESEETPAFADQEIETPGAVLATEVEHAHPLAVGVERSPPALFVGSRIWLPTGHPGNDVLTVRGEDPVLGGFVWPEAEERLRKALLVSAKSLGRGRIVIFTQEPAYRLFWRGTTPFFLNAVLYGPSLP